MSVSDDNEILQDFLVEAGEILELLGEQLVSLEQNPQDTDLLNAVFRGFHTVKGGAGFLNIVPMIDVCHRAEDVFNVLRQGERKVDADLMDAILKVVDILNAQFAQLSAGTVPVAAELALLVRLEEYAKPQSVIKKPDAAKTKGPPSVKGVVGGDNISESEFVSLLDALGTDREVPVDVPQAAPSAKVASIKTNISAGPDTISADEFESLLDHLHGAGKHSSVDVAPKNAPVHTRMITPGPETSSARDVSKASEGITDEEFEHLLDHLHGQGKINTSDMAAKQDLPQAKMPTPHGTDESNDDRDESRDSVGGKQLVRGAASDPTVRVDTKRLDDIMNMVGELVLVRNRLDTLKIRIADEEVTKAVANLGIVTSDLQAAVMKTRMQPIKKVFGRFPRVVRDLARTMEKEVNLELMGEDTDLDKNLVEALADPMVHLVRNSVDHGIELPAVRLSAGKKREGTIVLSAAQEGDHILLTVEDDGAGMDPQFLRELAVKKGVLDAEAAARLDDRECFNLIFAPGFSTKAKISDISGRGVGMDVVKTRITQLNGTVDVESEKGKGTRINIRLPLTLAILPTLMVKVADRTFALPLSSVNEIFSIGAYHKNVIDGQMVIMVRNKAMPLFYLYKWLVAHNELSLISESDQVVVANVGNQRVGFVVSQVVGQEEVVIKPLGTLLHGLPGFAGATITGDGRIALILDIPSLMKARTRRA